MKPLRVVNLTSAAAKLSARLPSNPGGLPVRLGWDGQQIAVFTGVTAGPTKSLPHERIELQPWMDPEEIEVELVAAALRLQRELPPALAKHGPRRTPRRGHRWRLGVIDRAAPRE